MIYVYVRRISDGQILDIPGKDLETTLRRGGFEEVKNVSTVYENSLVQFEPKKENFECPICGKKCKTGTALKTHKTKAH